MPVDPHTAVVGLELIQIGIIVWGSEAAYGWPGAAATAVSLGIAWYVFR